MLRCEAAISIYATAGLWKMEPPPQRSIAPGCTGHSYKAAEIFLLLNQISRSGRHFGCRIVLADDFIYISLGDRGTRDAAQIALFMLARYYALMQMARSPLRRLQAG